MGFSPRSGDLQIDGVPWLARMIDKARAKSNDTIEDYVFPCPLDQELLKKLQIDAESFQQIAVTHDSDQEILHQVRKQVAANNSD